VVFWNKAVWWVSKHITVDWPVSVELYMRKPGCASFSKENQN